MDNIQLLTIILTVVLTAMVILLITLGIIFMNAKIRKQKNARSDDKEKQNAEKEKKSKRKKYKEYTPKSIMDFMEFDTVVDNMIAQKEGKRYVMVIACQGINYDLMSQVEKNSVEEGFIQFLNTIKHPIQIYTQTRTINLGSSLQTYKEKAKQIEENLERQEMRYNEMRRAGTYTEAEIDRAYFNLTKQRNLYEYGKDIIYNTEIMSLNKNVLSQKYYVVIPYYIEDIEDSKFDNEELRGMAFAELYTRAQTVVRTLSACGVNGKIMTSNELVELLYMAYNRDEAEVYGIDKALKAGYDELYTTAPDVVDKQMKELDKQIEQEAIQKARTIITEARSDKQKALKDKQNNKSKLINELAKLIIEQNTQVIGEDVAKRAVEKVDESSIIEEKEKKAKEAKKVKKEGGAKDETIQEQKAKRTRKTKSAQ